MDTQNMIVKIQKLSSERIVKRQFFGLDVEAYISVYIPRLFKAIKLTPQMVSDDRSSDSIWDFAISNTEKALKVLEMDKVLGLSDSSPIGMYVVTTDHAIKSAAGLLFPGIFKKLCEENDMESCVIFPSSTEEVITVLNDSLSYIDIEDLVDMVSDINNRYVKEEIQLNPAVYKYSIKDNAISMVMRRGNG